MKTSEKKGNEQLGRKTGGRVLRRSKAFEHVVDRLLDSRLADAARAMGMDQFILAPGWPSDLIIVDRKPRCRCPPMQVLRHLDAARQL